MARTIDLNADVGEGADDAGLYPLVSSVSIACGGHAGDEASIEAAIRRAKTHGARIGAHPSYPDRQGWGRVSIEISMHDLRITILEQLETLLRIANRMHASVRHVKPHGALYHDAATDAVIAGVLAETIADRHPEMRMIAPPSSALVEACRDAGLEVLGEGFADRGYRDGALIPRGELGALIRDPADAAAQAVRLLEDPRIQTICVHGDTPGALARAGATRRALLGAGGEISAGG